MGRLNFSTVIELTPNVNDAAIVNIPDDTVEQIYFKDNKAYMKTAKLTYLKDYAGLQFGAAATLPYENVVACSIKSFPGFGSYGFITQEDDTRYSTLILNF